MTTEYAYPYASELDVVWWIRAEDPATLEADYASLARELDTAVLGPKHRHRARDLVSLAEVLRQRGEYTRGQECLKDALDIDTEILGKTHPDTLTAQDALISLAL